MATSMSKFKDENNDCLLDGTLNAARELERPIAILKSKKSKKKFNDPKPMHFSETRSDDEDPNVSSPPPPEGSPHHDC